MLASLFLLIACATSGAFSFENATVDNLQHIFLQTFTWSTLSDRSTHFATINGQISAISSAGFTGIWVPPISQSVDREGYLPQQWYQIVGETNLRSLVSNANSKGLLPIADVVVNHRTAPTTNTCTKDYTEFKNPDMSNWAVVSNDVKCEGGVFCAGGCGCGAADSGENICYAPDLDHTNTKVQQLTKEFVAWLRTNVGFKGIRWDVAKGFSAKYFGDYTAASGVSFAVGEYWDSNGQNVVNWIDGTGGRASAFDFPARYSLRDAIRANSYGALAGLPGVLKYWPEKSVTFTDNHDTTHSGDTFGDATQIVMGQAYILTHPGNPCVYWADWQAHKSTINTIISLRKGAGINASSKVSVVSATGGLYAAYINGRMAVKIGTNAWNPSTGYQLRASGNRWAIWTN